MLRQALPPLIAAYLTFAAMVVLASRRPVPRPRLLVRRPDHAWRREIVGTLAGGYLCLLAIVLVFHTWLGGEDDALAGAARGGAFLSAVALGVVAVRSAAALRGSRRPRSRDG